MRELFVEKSDDLKLFGATVNQTFEAYVFASVLRWYRENGWKVALKPPLDPVARGKAGGSVRLKFNTRGRPAGYSYGKCTKAGASILVRHQIRVSTSSDDGKLPSANICCDVAILQELDLTEFASDTAVPNDLLVTFGEAKHMSAFAELLASFIGVVHELVPQALEGVSRSPDHPPPFLYVSGYLYPTAKGIKRTIETRGLAVGVFDCMSPLLQSDPVPTRKPPSKALATRGKLRRARPRARVR
ncbi:MAG: hypothetical protein ACHREM_07055 [Polyangiales bacterium]